MPDPPVIEGAGGGPAMPEVSGLSDSDKRDAADAGLSMNDTAAVLAIGAVVLGADPLTFPAGIVFDVASGSPGWPGILPSRTTGRWSASAPTPSGPGRG